MHLQLYLRIALLFLKHGTGIICLDSIFVLTASFINCPFNLFNTKLSHFILVFPLLLNNHKQLYASSIDPILPSVQLILQIIASLKIWLSACMLTNMKLKLFLCCLVLSQITASCLISNIEFVILGICQRVYSLSLVLFGSKSNYCL